MPRSRFLPRDYNATAHLLLVLIVLGIIGAALLYGALTLYLVYTFIAAAKAF